MNVSLRTGASGLALVAAAACGAGGGEEPTRNADAPAPAPVVVKADREKQLVLDSLPALRAAADYAEPPIGRELATARKAILDGDHENGELLLAALLERYTGSGYIRLLLGVAIHEQKQYARAQPVFEEVLREFNEFGKSYNVLSYYGWCMFRQGKVDAALSAFEAHLEFAPGLVDTRNGLGLTLLEMGRIDEAEEQFLAALEASDDPKEQAHVHASLAEVHLRREDDEAARDALLESVRLFPPYQEAHFKLSRLFLRLGDDDLAAKHAAELESWKAEAKRADEEARRNRASVAGD